MMILSSDTSNRWNTAKIVWIFVGHLQFVLHFYLNLLPMNTDVKMYLVRTAVTYLFTYNNASKYGRNVINAKS